MWSRRLLVTESGSPTKEGRKKSWQWDWPQEVTNLPAEDSIAVVTSFGHHKLRRELTSHCIVKSSNCAIIRDVGVLNAHVHSPWPLSVTTGRHHHLCVLIAWPLYRSPLADSSTVSRDPCVVLLTIPSSDSSCLPPANNIWESLRAALDILLVSRLYWPSRSTSRLFYRTLGLILYTNKNETLHATHIRLGLRPHSPLLTRIIWFYSDFNLILRIRLKSVLFAMLQ